MNSPGGWMKGLWRLGAVATLALTACSSGDPSTPADAGADVVDESRVSRLVGAAGGAVTLGGTTLVVPPGALEDDTLVTITVTGDPAPAGYVAWSPVYRFGPPGLRFVRPVEVRIAFDGDASRAGVYWTTAAGVGYERRPGTVVGSVAVAAIDHFSNGFVGAELADAGRDGGADAPAPDASDGGTADVFDAPDVTADVPDAPIDAPTDAPTDAPIDAGVDVVDAAADAATDVGGMCVTGCAPRPVGPPSLSTVTSRRPSLRWVLSAGTDGARVDLCRDRAMTVGCISLDATGVRVVPTADLAVGRWFWRLRGRLGSTVLSAAGPVWQFVVPTRTTSVDSARPVGLDVNGDGFSDLAVASIQSRVVYVYYGSATGVAASPGATIVAPAGVTSFGFRVASVGDLDGNGCGDLAVTSSAGTGLYLGTPTGPASSPTTTLTGGTFAVISALGDVNGDGYGELGLDRQIIPGAASGVDAAAARSMTGAPRPAGDVNGDGYADVAVSPMQHPEVGSATVFLGSATGLAASPSVTLANPYSQPLYFASTAGDLNGDGFGDILSLDAFGHLLIHFGAAAGPGSIPAQVVNQSALETRFERPVYGVGDLNGDGFGELSIASESQFMTYAGTATGVRTDFPLGTTACASGAICGRSNVVGDYNGDGLTDVASGGGSSTAPFVRTGVVSIYYGTPSGFGGSPSNLRSDPWEFGAAVSGYTLGRFLTTASPVAAFACNTTESCTRVPGDALSAFGSTVTGLGDTAVLVGDPVANRVSRFLPATGDTFTRTDSFTGNAGAEFGAALAAVGDVNGDGRLDFVVGAPGEGRAYVYLGGASGYPSTPSATLVGAAGSRFGVVVAAAGDVNGDSFNDVLVGAPDSAAAYLYLGGAGGVSTTAASVLSGPAGSRFGAALTTLRDVDGDGRFDVMIGAPGAASAYVYRGTASGALGAATTTLTGPAGSEFGASVTVLWGVGTARVLNPVVGAPGSAQVFAYGVTGGAVVSAPVWTGSGDPGSRYGASVSGLYLQPFNTGVIDHLIVASPNSRLITMYTRLCTGASCPGPFYWNVTSTRSDFGVWIASADVRRPTRA